MNFGIENIKNAQEQVSALESSAAEMRAAHKAIDIDKLEDLHDDIADLMADAEDINEIMARSYE